MTNSAGCKLPPCLELVASGHREASEAKLPTLLNGLMDVYRGGKPCAHKHDRHLEGFSGNQVSHHRFHLKPEVRRRQVYALAGWNAY